MQSAVVRARVELGTVATKAAASGLQGQACPCAEYQQAKDESGT